MARSRKPKRPEPLPLDATPLEVAEWQVRAAEFEYASATAGSVAAERALSQVVRHRKELAELRAAQQRSADDELADADLGELLEEVEALMQDLPHQVLEVILGRAEEELPGAPVLELLDGGQAEGAEP